MASSFMPTYATRLTPNNRLKCDEAGERNSCEVIKQLVNIDLCKNYELKL